MVIHLYKWLMVLGSLWSSPAKQASSPALPHPLFVSVTEITHNATDKNLEVSCKLFTDDFEKTLGSIYRKKVDLVNPVNKAETEKEVAEYIRKRLVVTLDGKPVTLEFVGFERENEAIWSYFQAAVPVAPKKIEIKNTILYEAYDKQINLMHVAVGGNRKSTRLNYPDTDAKFEF
jgi:hypothetical protein